MWEDKKPEKCATSQKVLMNHRMHRSSVRPFFCCGSQVSLNSISESKDLADNGNKTDDDYEDLTDSDDTENFEFVSKPDRLVQRLSKGSTSKRKKYGLKLLDKQSARNKFWRLRGKLQVARYPPETDECSLAKDVSGCVCTSLKKDNGESLKLNEAAGGVPEQKDPVVASPLSKLACIVPPPGQVKEGKPGKVKGKSKSNGTKKETPLPFINLNKLYPINDIDQQRIEHRRREMERGVDVPADDSDTVWIHKSEAEEEAIQANDSDASLALVPSRNSPSVGQYPSYGAMGLLAPQADVPRPKSREYSDEDMVTTSTISLNSCPWLPMLMLPAGVHTQVDYKHYLVPNLDDIVRSSFYWGVMDRYEAERLIDKKPEGTFLLRDSAQDDFLFSVSFRRYGRSLHARIEQWNHNFSFDSRDPGVFATDSVCGLIEHYKDPSSCMFFEPMLTQPLHRSTPFSLQHLARATICSNTTYDGVTQLTLPRSLKDYLRCYHYKQKVRVRRFENAA